MICRICKIDKDLDEFYPSKITKCGFMHECKLCRAKIAKIYQQKNRIKLSKYGPVWYNMHKKEALKQRVKLKNNYSEDEINQIKDKQRIYHKIYYQKHKAKLNQQKVQYHKNRRHTDPIFKLSKQISTYINRALQGKKHGRHWEILVGYTLEELKIHLETQFINGMTWENHGKWHIDHILPRSSFHITSAECEDFKKCWALDNLQPLWAEDNLRKSNKFSTKL